MGMPLGETREQLRWAAGWLPGQRLGRWIVEFFVGVSLVVGTPIFFGLALSRYPLLDEGDLINLVGAGFVSSMVAVVMLLRRRPRILRLMGIGEFPGWMSWAMVVVVAGSLTALLCGAILWANGSTDRTERVRELRIVQVATWHTRQGTRQMRLTVSPWNTGEPVIQLDWSRSHLGWQEWLALAEAKHVRLTIGLGRLGLPWIRQMRAVTE
ncbi:MAG: hypothetical protein HY597_01210 [Candidatus Omnitrophica bacterium]|nr:hypothetical protein [Candidatus Omnitrophota bacterium]